jgi:hypothetical protein
VNEVGRCAEVEDSGDAPALAQAKVSCYFCEQSAYFTNVILKLIFVTSICSNVCSQ